MNIFDMYKIASFFSELKKKLKEVTMSDKLKSRKFWLTVFTALLIIVNRALGLGLDEDTITKVVALVVGYDVGQGLAEIVNKK